MKKMIMITGIITAIILVTGCGTDKEVNTTETILTERVVIEETLIEETITEKIEVEYIDSEYAEEMEYNSRTNRW